MDWIRQLFSQFGNLLRWWVVLMPWERAVRVRLGRRVTILGEGVHLRVPYADRIFKQNVRLRYTNIPTQTIVTLDGRVLTVRGVMGYVVKDIAKLYGSVHHPEPALYSAAQGAISAWVRSRTGDECRPAELEEYLRRELDFARFGLGDAEVFITDFVAARTYRFIQGEPKDYMEGDLLNTHKEELPHVY